MGIANYCSICLCRLPYALLIGLAAGVCMSPIGVFHALANAVIAVVWLPHDVFLTYRAVLKTGMIGTNLKVLAMLLLPIALVAWPAFVLLVTMLIAVPICVSRPVERAFSVRALESIVGSLFLFGPCMHLTVLFFFFFFSSP
jgi:hypothetical protein